MLFETKPVPEQPEFRPVQVNVVQKKGFLENMKTFYASNKLYIWASLVGIALIVLLSWLAFRPRPQAAPTVAKVTVSIEAPQSVASGGEVVYKVKVENQDKQKLMDGKLDITYPEGATFLSSTPKPMNISGSLFQLPELIPGQNAVVIIKAKVSGSVNDTKELRAKATYKLGNFSNEYATEQSHGVRLGASDIAVTIEGPNSTSNAQIIKYTVKFKNNSQETIKNGRLEMTYPQGFNYAASQPDPSLGNNIWNVSELKAGEEKVLDIQGTYASAQPGETKTIKADFLILSGSGEYFAQGGTSFNTQLSSLPLIVNQEVDAGDFIVGPGDKLSYTIKFQNNATVVANGVNIIATVDGKALDLSTIRAEGASVSGNTITWNASSLSQLEHLNPNEQGQVSYEVEVKDPATKDSAKNLSVNSTVKIKSDEYSTYFPGNDLQVKVATRASMETSLSHVDGSLPPQVGKTTLYRVKITLKNATNDISDTAVTGFIPLGAGGFQQGSVPGAQAGNFQYDASSGRFTWNLGSLPAHTGTFSGTKSVEFNVQLKPSASQNGQTPTLVKDIKFSGVDSFTTSRVEFSSDNITTSDLQGSGYSSGAVIP